jgi:hypothetical protein
MAKSRTPDEDWGVRDRQREGCRIHRGAHLPDLLGQKIALHAEDGLLKEWPKLQIRITQLAREGSLIMTAKLNDVDPQAWLADVLARINDHAIHRLEELLPWNWALEMERRKVAA